MSLVGQFTSQHNGNSNMHIASQANHVTYFVTAGRISKAVGNKAQIWISQE